MRASVHSPARTCCVAHSYSFVRGLPRVSDTRSGPVGGVGVPLAPSIGTFIQEGVLIPGLFTICPQNSALSFCPLPVFFIK